MLLLSDLLGGRPPEMALVGLQPEDWDTFGGELTALARERIPAAMDLAIKVLDEWGVFATPRPNGVPENILFPRALLSSR